MGLSTIIIISSVIILYAVGMYCLIKDRNKVARKNNDIIESLYEKIKNIKKVEECDEILEEIEKNFYSLNDFDNKIIKGKYRDMYYFVKGIRFNLSKENDFSIINN